MDNISISLDETPMKYRFNAEQVIYAIVLAEHKNKTPKQKSGHKYLTCHFGRFEKFLFKSRLFSKLL